LRLALHADATNSQIYMICIVDDDPFVRDATVDLLNSLGHAAAAFESGEKFLDSGRVTDALCLILDQQMPGLNGLELQNKLIADGNRAAIIFITAFPDQKSRDRALSAGAVAYLAKPYKQDDLIGALQAALSGR
jgi:FixJ family two-component response regulator